MRSEDWFESGYRRIYVDRICINQDDIAEKQSQILKMESIFKSASEVLIWLGDSSHGSDKVLDLIKNWKPTVDSRGFRDNHLWRQVMSPPPTTAEVDHLFSREYWFRSWIIQEIIVAKA